MTYTVRNTREKAMSLTGIKVVSNTLLPQATLDLKDTALERIPAGGRLPWTDYGADYADHATRMTSLSLTSLRVVCLPRPLSSGILPLVLYLVRPRL